MDTYPHRSARLRRAIVANLISASWVVPASAAVRVWEKQELTFTSAASFSNPYTDVVAWVDLTGPLFHKRVYGFWDGGRTFRVRLVATGPGLWNWTSGSTPRDAGLDGKAGSFTAVEWSDKEKQENPLRRGFLRATANGHALETADGTPFFVIGDTWWAAVTNRFRGYDGNQERPIDPTAGFKDYAHFRKAQGYNWINMIAAFPNWMTDGAPWHVVMNNPEKTTVRSGWIESNRSYPITRFPRRRRLGIAVDLLEHLDYRSHQQTRVGAHRPSTEDLCLDRH